VTDPNRRSGVMTHGRVAGRQAVLAQGQAP